MTKKKATPPDSDPGKAIGILLADAASMRQAITELSSRVAELERGPIRRLLRRIFRRERP